MKRYIGLFIVMVFAGIAISAISPQGVFRSGPVPTTNNIAIWAGPNSIKDGAGFGGNGFNVMAYGAKCDGTTDDSIAIQNAVNAWKAAGPTFGGTVILSGPGLGNKCLVTQPIDFTNTSALSPWGGIVRDLWLYGVFQYAGPIGTASVTAGGAAYNGGGTGNFVAALTGGSGLGCTGVTLHTTLGVVDQIVSLLSPGCGNSYATDDVLAITGGNGAGRLTVNTLSGGAIIDAIGSRFISWENVVTEGDCTNIPNAGWAIGRVSAVNADDHYFKKVQSIGCWQFAGFYNLGSETAEFDHMLIFTARAIGSHYGLVQDGMNHFNWSSTFKTETLTVDAPVSFNGNQFNNLSIQTNASASATPIWIGRASGHKFLSSYSAGAGACGAVLFAAGASTRSVYLYFDMHFETTAMISTFCLKGGDTNFTLIDFEYYEFASQVTTEIFTPDAGISAVIAYGLRVQIANMNALATLYGTPAIWSVTPIRIEVPVIGNYVAPGTSRAGGWICIGSAACTPS